MSCLPAAELFTVGHSTRSLDDLFGLLKNHGIECLIDVRTAPRSRHMPHFARDSLERELPATGIAYRHEPDLGGWRRPVSGSPNGGWRSKSFQGYADHMATPEFEDALGRAMLCATERRTALMCAEALPWRCHRMLIADALTVRGWRVHHLGAGREPEVHQLTTFALAVGERITYPPAQLDL